jgi:hypothetical protein
MTVAGRLANLTGKVGRGEDGRPPDGDVPVEERVRMRIRFKLLVVAFAWWSGSGLAAEYKNSELGFVVTTDNSWSTAVAEVTKAVSQVTAQSAIVHARTNGVNATLETVDSAVLLLHSKLPLGAMGDNPNLVLAKEKAWAEKYEKTGAGYLKLMQDRVAVLRAPTKFIGDAKQVEIGEITFHQMDAVNAKVPDGETKQRYICTYMDGYYVFFVLSLNDERDADFATMMKVVHSFRKVAKPSGTKPSGTSTMD